MTPEPQTVEEAARFAAITPKTVGRLSGLGKNTVYAAIQRGEIPSVTIGGRILVPTLPFLELFGAGRLCQAAGSSSADEATPSQRVTTEVRGVNPSDDRRRYGPGREAGAPPGRKAASSGGPPGD